MERLVGTVSRGVRAPIIRQGDDIAAIVVDSVLAAAKSEGFELRNRDIVAVTEAVVAVLIFVGADVEGHKLHWFSLLYALSNMICPHSSFHSTIYHFQRTCVNAQRVLFCCTAYVFHGTMPVKTSDHIFPKEGFHGKPSFCTV